MQYANTSRKGAEANNAGFCSGSAVVRVSAAGGGGKRAASANTIQMGGGGVGRNRE